MKNDQFVNIGLEETNIAMKDVLGYLRLEEGAPLTEEALIFIGKAKIAPLEYWLWKYIDSQDNVCFAIVVKSLDENADQLYLWEILIS